MSEIIPVVSSNKFLIIIETISHGAEALNRWLKNVPLAGNLWAVHESPCSICTEHCDSGNSQCSKSGPKPDTIQGQQGLNDHSILHDAVVGVQGGLYQ